MNRLLQLTACALSCAWAAMSFADDVTFTTGGNASWFQQSVVTYDGTPAWQIGDLSSFSEYCYVDGDYTSLDYAWSTSSPAWKRNELVLAEAGTHTVEPTPSRSVGEFLGWYTAEIGGEPVTEDDCVKFNVTELYAHWGMDIDKALVADGDIAIPVTMDIALPDAIVVE